MKNFNEFKKIVLLSDKYNEIGQKAVDKANELTKNEQFETSSDEILFHQRAVMQHMIMYTLEEYHKWLNE